MEEKEVETELWNFVDEATMSLTTCKWDKGPRLLRGWGAPGFLRSPGWGLGVTDRVINGRVVHLHGLSILDSYNGDRKLHDLSLPLSLFEYVALYNSNKDVNVGILISIL